MPFTFSPTRHVVSYHKRITVANTHKRVGNSPETPFQTFLKKMFEPRIKFAANLPSPKAVPEPKETDPTPASSTGLGSVGALVRGRETLRSNGRHASWGTWGKPSYFLARELESDISLRGRDGGTKSGRICVMPSLYAFWHVR